MKLYTEEQVLKIIQKKVMDKPETYDEVLKYYTPIELPSDEEIAKHMTSVWFADNMHRECFKLGAIWMKTQILNQNK